MSTDIKALILKKASVVEVMKWILEEITPSNPHARDANGKSNIIINEYKQGVIPIICPVHDTQDDDNCRLDVRRQKFTCYSAKCPLNNGTSGLNVIDMVMTMKFGVPVDLLTADESKKEFKDSLKWLCNKLGIEYDFNHNVSQAEAYNQRKREALKRAAEIYHEFFKTHPQNKIAKDYVLSTRKLPESIVDKAKLGFAPGSFGTRIVTDMLIKEGFEEQLLVDSGVAYKFIAAKYATDPNKEKYAKIIDKLSFSVIYPYTLNGAVVNLYGRNLQEGNKFRHNRLSGTVIAPLNYDLARRFEDIIIVEGEFSMLSILSMGFENVIATGGANGFKESYIPELFEHLRVKRWYLCFDPDLTGAKKTIELAEDTLAKYHYDIRVVILPSRIIEKDGKKKIEGDPNDFIKWGYTAEDFQKRLDESLTLQEFKILYEIQKREPKTYADKIECLKHVKPILSELDAAQIEIMSKSVGKMLDISPEYILYAWHGIKPFGIFNLEEAAKYSWALLTNNKTTACGLYYIGLDNAFSLDGNNISNVISKLKELGVSKLVLLSCVDGFSRADVIQMQNDFLSDFDVKILDLPESLQSFITSGKRKEHIIQLIKNSSVSHARKAQ